ncbi:MAG: flagellar basal body rod protein FlgC [Planctomycetota bacterium]
MGYDSLFRCLDVSASGLKAERARMDTVAQNIANANVTRAKDGKPYRRQEVVFETVLEKGDRAFGGVRVSRIEQDNSPYIEVMDPGHPDADANGVVHMPNVRMPFEMVDMITAARAYEANLNLIKTFKQMVERALAMGR